MLLTEVRSFQRAIVARSGAGADETLQIAKGLVLRNAVVYSARRAQDGRFRGTLVGAKVAGFHSGHPQDLEPSKDASERHKKRKAPRRAFSRREKLGGSLSLSL